MKREDLKKLLGDGATDETIDAIMKLHGTDIESHKTKVTDLTTQLENASKQITEANAQIEKFKSMKPEDLQKAADDYKAQFEKAQQDHAAQLSELKFNHALEAAVTGAKAKNIKAVTALLSRDTLKLKDDGTIEGLDDQIKTIKEQNDYLFEGDKPTPKIVTNTNNQPVVGSALEAAVWKGAGIKPPQSQ